MTISGNNATRVFNISGSTTDVEITRLTIADGSATGTTMTGPLGPVTLGGGILNNGGHLIVSHVTLADNQVVGFNGGGGAIANVFGATLTVDHSTFTGNEAVGTREAAGGAIAQRRRLVLDRRTQHVYRQPGHRRRRQRRQRRRGLRRGHLESRRQPGHGVAQHLRRQPRPAAATAPTAAPPRTAATAATAWAAPSPT